MKIGVQEGADGTFSGVKTDEACTWGGPNRSGRGEAYRTGKKIENGCGKPCAPPKGGRYHHEKKSTFAAILVFFAAIAGALTAAYMYLRRRRPSWMNMSSSCSVRISAMRNLRRKKPPQRTRRMTPRMTSRF